MVSKTFQGLPEAKRQRVEAALLAEFSRAPLATAQVARIVIAAGIARGAFYKYFDDLNDAYQYLFRQVMVAVHQKLPQAKDAYAATAAFVVGSVDSQYHDFLRLHFAYNSSVLGHREPPVGDDASAWAEKVLCHDTIRACLLDPPTATSRLALLRQALLKLQQ